MAGPDSIPDIDIVGEFVDPLAIGLKGMAMLRLGGVGARRQDI